MKFKAGRGLFALVAIMAAGVSVFAGQAQVHHNPLTLNGVSFASTPRQPARQEAWNAEWLPPYWRGDAHYDPQAVLAAVDPVPNG